MLDLILCTLGGATIGGGAVALVAGAATQRLEGRLAALQHALDQSALKLMDAEEDRAEQERYFRGHYLSHRALRMLSEYGAVISKGHFRNPKTGRIGKQGQVFE